MIITNDLMKKGFIFIATPFREKQGCDPDDPSPGGGKIHFGS